jgi:alkanesulfonate monooxygenase SsuD/methylene tetrahydromethanopterin reductase-like flavin-dependent oxidoreductase (luciferase family)
VGAAPGLTQQVQFAIQTPPQQTSFGALRDVWAAADELGYSAAFTFDHLVALNPGERPGWGGGGDRRGPQFEGWTALAVLAGSTRRLQVGTLVSSVTLRHPVLLAKMAVTLDHATEGRAILGVGAGWHEEEHRMFGAPFPGAGERLSRLDECLEIFARVCREDVVDFDGRFYRLRGAVCDPKPVRAEGLPVLVGGSGARLKRVAGRHAQFFNGFAAPWEWPAVHAELDAALRDAGRGPGSLARSAHVFVCFSQRRSDADRFVDRFCRSRGGTAAEARARTFVGDADAMAHVARAYADNGASLLVLSLAPPYDPRDLDWFATNVMAVCA